MKLIPFVSTHLKLLVDSVRYCTVGKIYSIKEWKNDFRGLIRYQIEDDYGIICNWFYDEHDPEVEDASFEVNLQKILEE